MIHSMRVLVTGATGRVGRAVVDLLFPPRLDAAVRPGYLALTRPVNLAGFSALALPIPSGQRLPASLQLIGGPNAEALLLATGAMIEAAA